MILSLQIKSYFKELRFLSLTRLLIVLHVLIVLITN